jgi:hypothetical protein
MFDKICPSLKTRLLIDERKFDISRSDKNSERYVIPMHTKNVWTSKSMQDPRKNFLQINYHDSSTQYKKGWGSFKIKTGLTLCCSCRRPEHMAKECPGRRSSCLCCKDMDHEVIYFPRMIAKLERMNTRQENPKADPETKTMAEPQKESKTVLLQIKETLNDHQHINLSKIFKEKEYIEPLIGDFDIDYVLDEQNQVNIMTKRTWEILGRPAMIPSLGGIGLLRGKLINLCWKLTQISMNANGTSTEEEFEIVKFIKNNTPFAILLGKPWIERDQVRRKEEEVLEQKKQ